MKNTRKIIIVILGFLIFGTVFYFTDPVGLKGAILRHKIKPIAPASDLVAQNLYVDQGSTNDGVINVGDPLTLYVEILNRGNATTTSGFTSGFYVDGTLYIQRSTGPLVAGAHEFEDSAQWIPQRVGVIPIRVCADMYGLIAESDETNNCQESSVVVGENPPTS